MSTTVHDVIIIGSGPAGLTAAIYAARADLAPVVVEGVAVGGPTGGQLTLTTDVENYPGFPSGVTGAGLIADMRSQAERFGSTFITKDVASIDFSDDPAATPHVLSMDDGTSLSCRALIVATGARPRRLEVPGESELWGGGVSACATCDGFFFRDKHVVVVGGGDTACEEATFLTKFASRVTVVHRRDELNASKVMADRMLADPKVEVVWDTEVAAVNGDGVVESVTLRDIHDGSERILPCDGMFLAIGHIPNTQLVDNALEVDGHGYLIVEDPSTATAVPGVFAAGDVADPIYRQAITAAGSGCRAALDAERWLSEHV